MCDVLYAHTYVCITILCILYVCTYVCFVQYPQTASLQKQKQLEGSYSGVQMVPPSCQGESVFEQSITVMGIPRPPEPLGKLSSTPNHLEKTASREHSTHVVNCMFIRTYVRDV